MKCDELKSLKNIEVAYNTTTGKEQAIAEYSDGTCHGFDSDEEVYLKADVDEAIAELKAKLENVQASMYCDVVDANMENRRLKRALYKACVNWMINRQHAMRCYHLDARAKKFDKAIAKCEAKAEEYK